MMHTDGRSSSPSIGPSKGDGLPPGCVSIPVQIIRSSDSARTSSPSRQGSPYRTMHKDSLYNNGNGVSASPAWSSSTLKNGASRFQPRHSPNNDYDRYIRNSHFNQPLFERPLFQQSQPKYRPSQQYMHEPGTLQSSRSSDDLLSTPDTMRESAQSQYSSNLSPSFGSGLSRGFGFRPESDFFQQHHIKYPSTLRRSFDALNDFSDMPSIFPTNQPFQSEQQQPSYRSSFQTHQPKPTYANQAFINPNIVYTNERGEPMKYSQSDAQQETPKRYYEGSPTSRDASPPRPQPSSQQKQQPQETTPMPQHQVEEELKMANDTDGPIPMPAPAPSSTPSADPQVSSNDPSITSTTNASSPRAPSTPVRDPNTIALEKLEQIKAGLERLDKEVDEFSGSSRNDRIYKLLDEQILKMMLRCDELVDVSAEIKEKRKYMIRNLHTVLAKLEAKVPPTPGVESNSNPIETALTSDDSSANNNATSVNANERELEDKQMPSSNPSKEQSSTSQTASEPSTIS